MELFIAFSIAALIIEKIIERVKEQIPWFTDWRTSILALLLGAGLAWGVPQLRILELLFDSADEYVDLAFSALALAAGSGFIASLEGFLKPDSLSVTGNIDKVEVNKDTDDEVVLEDSTISAASPYDDYGQSPNA